MATRAKTYYCKNHGWVVNNPCMACDNPTKEFERRGGTYYVADIGRPLTSVTQIISVINKPQLIPWAARTAAKFAFENPTSSLEDAVASTHFVKKSAGKRGGDIHDLILEGKFEEVLPEYQGYIKAYKSFCEAMPRKTILSEKIVYSDTYGGRFDELAEINGKIYLLDYKTNNSGLYPETAYQLSAYKHAKWMEPEYGKKGVEWNHNIQGLLGVHLSADGVFSTREYEDKFEVFQALEKVFNDLHL